MHSECDFSCRLLTSLPVLLLGEFSTDYPHKAGVKIGKMEDLAQILMCAITNGFVLMPYKPFNHTIFFACRLNCKIIGHFFSCMYGSTLLKK